MSFYFSEFWTENFEYFLLLSLNELWLASRFISENYLGKYWKAEKCSS